MAYVLVHKKIRAYRSILAYVGSSMKSVSIHTFARVCYGSVVQSGRTLVSKTKCQRFKSFRGRQVFGLVVKWDNGGFASLSWEFDSPSVHQIWRCGYDGGVAPDCKSGT
jgi:hypothetical protein